MPKTKIQNGHEASKVSRREREQTVPMAGFPGSGLGPGHSRGEPQEIQIKGQLGLDHQGGGLTGQWCLAEGPPVVSGGPAGGLWGTEPVRLAALGWRSGRSGREMREQPALPLQMGSKDVCLLTYRGRGK